MPIRVWRDARRVSNYRWQAESCDIDFVGGLFLRWWRNTGCAWFARLFRLLCRKRASDNTERDRYCSARANIGINIYAACFHGVANPIFFEKIVTVRVEISNRSKFDCRMWHFSEKNTEKTRNARSEFKSSRVVLKIHSIKFGFEQQLFNYCIRVCFLISKFV